MVWVQLITLLAVVQLFAFGGLVGWARGRYGVSAPATSGNEMFERYYRVQMNTLETLLVFLPALWIAAQYWSAQWMSALGAVYLVGRMLYLQGYVADPKKRGLGYAVSIFPTLTLTVAALVGVVRALF